MQKPQTLLLAVLMATAALAFASKAQADTPIIVDSLTSTTPTAIDGRVPATDTPGSAWTQDGYAGWYTTATGAVSNQSQGVGDAYISIPTLSSGAVYTYQVTEAGLVGGEAEMGLIDVETESNGVERVYNVNGPSITLDGGGDFYTAGGEIRPNDSGYPSSTGALGPNVLKLVIDTTDASAWTVQTIINGHDLGTAALSNSLGLDALEISQGGGQPTFSNLSYSESVAPEPATWAFLALGVGLLGFHLRRRRA